MAGGCSLPLHSDRPSRLHCAFCASNEAVTRPHTHLARRTGLTGLVGVMLVVFVLLDVAAFVAASSVPFYVDNGLQQTVMLQRLPRREKRGMEQEILTLLGLHHRPKPPSPHVQSAPKFMMDLYRTLQRGDDGAGEEADPGVMFHSDSNQTSSLGLDSRNVEGSDVIMSFVNHAHRISFPRHERDQTFYFDFTDVSPGELVNGAELRIYKEKSRRWTHATFTVELYRLRQGQDAEEKLPMLESSVEVKGGHSGWLRLNVTRAADMWTLFPLANQGLWLRVVNRKGRMVRPAKLGMVGRGGPGDKQPFMVGFFRMSQELKVRRARSTRKKQTHEDVTYSDDPYSAYSASRNGFGAPLSRPHAPTCQRQTLYVSFRDLGWQDWIIAPDGYSAWYCAGACEFPLGAHLNATNHAIVQTLVHLLDAHLVPKPCCAPTRLAPISVLYFDHNSNVVLKRYRDMIVRACGCH